MIEEDEPKKRRTSLMVCRFGVLYYIAFDGFGIKNFSEQTAQKWSLNERHVMLV